MRRAWLRAAGSRRVLRLFVPACRIVKEYLEWEQALSGEEDNPWGWVRKRLIGVRGYKPWFGQLFTKDQLEIRYRDIHADLRAVREHMEKEQQEHKKTARAGFPAAGGAGGSGDKGKGRAEAKRPAYQDMDPMRRAHLFGVGIQAHVVSPWAALEEHEAAAKAASGPAAGAQPGHQREGLGAHAASAAGGSEGARAAAGKKRKPATAKTATDATEGKLPKVPKGARAPRDRAWIRFQQLFASTELSEVALRIKYEEACKAGTVDAMLDGKMEVPDGQGVAAARSAEAAAVMGSSNGGGGGNAQPEGGGVWANLTLAEKLRARCAGNTPPAAGAAQKAEAFPTVESSAPGGDASAAPRAQGARSAGALAGGAEATPGDAAHSSGGSQHAGDGGQARGNGDRGGTAGGRLSQQGGAGVQRGVADQCGAFALSEHTDGKKMAALKNLSKNAREQETAS